jgi:hypothetical protein
MIMWTKTKTVAALLSVYIAQGAAKTRGAGKKLEGQKLCLEYGFLNDVVAKGSSTPIGSFAYTTPSGLSGLLGACAGQVPGAVCCNELAAAGTLGPFDDAFKCLSKPANGPLLVGPWWLQRDVNNGAIFFEKDAVCGSISNAELSSRTRLELWDDKYIDMPLGLFKEFKVDYDFRAGAVSGNSGGYLNFYLRSAASNTNYYDCRFDFLIPNQVGRGTLAITPETPGSANPRSDSINAANSCTGTKTIKEYLTANSGAVMGVGNGEKYAFVLNTGSTNQDNSGQVICWSDVSIERVDAAGTKFFDTYKFTTL